MIYGPKNDGTSIVEFKTAAGEVMAISIPRERDGSDPAFSGAHALRTVRPGSSVRNLWRAHVICQGQLSPSISCVFPENPPRADSQEVVKGDRDQQNDPSNQYLAKEGRGEQHLPAIGEQQFHYPLDRSQCQHVCAGLGPGGTGPLQLNEA
jgi:hypothetical protein